MEYESFLIKLGRALDEPVIQEQIMAILTASQPDDTDELRRLRNTLEAREREYDALRKERDRLQEKNAGLRKQLNEYKTACEDFAPLLTQYECYRSLPETVRLEKILSSETPMKFWMTGSRIDHIFRFWDEIQRNVEQLTTEQRRILAEVITFFVGQINSTWERPLYEMMSDEIGKPFEEKRHVRSADCSRYQGNVQEVLLEGIWNVDKKCAERRCIVFY